MLVDVRTVELRGITRSVLILPRRIKRLVMFVADVLALPACLALAVWLVTPAIHAQLPVWIWAVPAIIGLPVLRLSGFYRSVVRFMGLELTTAALKGVSLVSIVLLMLCFAEAYEWTDAVRASATFWFLGIVYIVGSRLAVRWALQSRSAGLSSTNATGAKSPRRISVVVRCAPASPAP